MFQTLIQPRVPPFHRRDSKSRCEWARPSVFDSHYYLSVLGILDARTLQKKYEEIIGADTPGEEPRAAIDRGGAAYPPRELVAKIPRRMFADPIRRCPADVLLDVCDAPPPGAAGSFHVDVTYIAALWLQEARRHRLPISTAEIAKMLRDAESARPRDYDTEEAMLQRARDALFRFATDSAAGCSNARFLRLRITATLDELRARTDAMVDPLLSFLEEVGSKHACVDAWSPERLAAAACVHRKCVDGAKDTASRRRAHVAGLPNYTPGDRIEDLGALAAHVPRRCGADAPEAPRDQEECLPPPPHPRRPHEGKGQAVAAPMVVCLLCHEGFRSNEALDRRANVHHGGRSEYRKRVAYMMQEAGLQPMQPWRKRQMIASHAFFARYSVPGSRTNDWTDRAAEAAVPRRQEACVVCAVKDWVEKRLPVYLFVEPTSSATWTEYLSGRATSLPEGHDHEFNDNAPPGNDEDEPTGTVLLKDGVLCFGPRAQVDALLSVRAYAKDWPNIPVEELHASSVQHPADPQMRWLLHTRRVPTRRAPAAGGAGTPARGGDGPQEQGGTPRPPCAGVGLSDRTAWACAHCAAKLCARALATPTVARANWMWLGRVAP